MKQHPALYWRQFQEQKNLLGQVGTIMSLTQVQGQNHWVGVIKLANRHITAAIVATTRFPRIGDNVTGVVRIVDKEGDEGLIHYGIKFQLQEEGLHKSLDGVMSKVLMVDEQDTVTGKLDKMLAHQGAGIRHRAFSILILNRNKQLLLQKRSPKKPLWPDYWTNTCCSHPQLPTKLLDQAQKRLSEELGFTTSLKKLFVLPYKAIYENNMAENEITHVVYGFYDGNILPNPKEVADFKWVTWKELQQEIEQKPDTFTPWFKLIADRIHNNKQILPLFSQL